MSERNGFEQGVPCWVDTWQPDAQAAREFYSELFGWQAGPGDPYERFTLRGRDVAGIGQQSGDWPGPPVPVWTTYVQVDSADAACQAVSEAGGSVLVEPTPSLDGGQIAIVADRAGGALGVWQLGEHGGAQVVNEPAAWSISALRTPDPDRAAGFYGAVFGWEAEQMDPAITLFRLPGYIGGEPQQPVPRDVVAVMIAADDAPPSWAVDFWVDDADTIAARVVELGGSVLIAPFDTPISRSAVLVDPQGAAFNVTTVPAVV
jgi:predicted enzyme related to lactoylglutathione lyase